MVAASPPLPLMSFDEACTRVVRYLKEAVPLAFWSVSHFDGERQVYHYVEDEAYGAAPGGSHAWSDSMCQFMVSGATPQIAPDAMAVPQYAAAGVAHVLDIGAYVGVPIRDGDGTLYGTLCGLDPAVQDPQLLAQEPLLHLMATLLGQILHAERMRADALEREAQLQWAAFHDALTGLANRPMFLDLVARALDRQDGPVPSVLLLDVDDFKAVNDTLGHAAGDRLLILIAGRLQRALGPRDVLARLSGDEFAILPGDDRDAAGIARLVVEVLHEPFVVDGAAVPVSASVGVAALSHDAEFDVDAVLAHADIAMYSAKHGGKSRFAIYHPEMTLPGIRDLQLRGPLRDALASGAVEALYQPIVELDSGRVIAFEALARWTHHGFAVAPDVFIPVAARAGLLPDLTDHMLDRAAAQLAIWSQVLGHDRLQVSVNVPPGLIGDPTFPGRVADCITRHGLAPQQLILEITEDALLTDPQAAQVVAKQLNAVGATLSLDDFGTGYSSLLHLSQIPLSSVKIDRGFTADLDTDPVTERFMRAVLALGHDLGLRVIVEGVERSEQADVLQRLFATHGQGHYFGRPARASDIDVRPDLDEPARAPWSGTGWAPGGWDPADWDPAGLGQAGGVRHGST